MPGLWFNPNPAALSSLLEVRLVEVVHYFLSVQRRMKETEKLKIEMEMFLVRIKLNPWKLGRKCFKLYWGGVQLSHPNTSVCPFNCFFIWFSSWNYKKSFQSFQSLFSSAQFLLVICWFQGCQHWNVSLLEGQVNPTLWSELKYINCSMDCHEMFYRHTEFS